ncbi:MAG: tetratricopeptide repeat protein [Chitinophagaceae bacterium]|nr:tetratricopeptide repeat protein [Chitinophagaceae bacterium]MCW5927282.1 tetratricopeptide repeat protein [Chitinophagaceae bacterium]
MLISFLICFWVSTHVSRANAQATHGAETGHTTDTARINTLIRLAEGYLRTDIALADSLANEAYQLLPESGYDEALANCLLLLSYTGSSTGAREGFSQCRKAISISEDIKDKKLLSRSYNQLYLLYYQKGDYDSATLAAERSLAIAREINFKNMLARGHQNFGILNSIKGRHTAAIENFLISEQYYTGLGDDFALAMLLGNLGVTFQEAGNLDKALEYMHKELALSTKIKNEHLQAWSMVNLGSVHSQSGRSDSVLHYYDQSLEIARRINNHDLIITNLDNIGSYYSGQKAYEKATQFLMDAFLLAEQTGYSYQNVYTAGHMAENYLAQGKLDSAMYYAEKKLDIAVRNELINDQKLAYAILARIYSAQKDYAKAYDALVSHTAINDSIFSTEKSKQIEELRERYESEKKDNLILLLQEQQEAATFRRTAYMLAGLLIGGVLLLLYFRERTISRKNLRLLEKEQELERMKSRFFTNISHEFRTPLTLILGPIDMLNSGPLDPQQKLHVGMLQRNANRLLSLTNQLLDLAKLESGKLRLQATRGDIVSFMNGIIHAFDSLAETKGIRLTTDLQERRLEVYFDTEKIETALINLLSNAFKFTPEGGRIAVGLRTSTQPDNRDCCIITIRDNGSGIPENELEDVFNRFYRAANANSRGYEGTGVGLALTRELIELHKGSVDIVSREGEGTEVTIQLPLGRSHLSDSEIFIADNAGEQTWTEGYVPDGFTGASIDEAMNHPAGMQSDPILLVIEDNEEVMLYIRTILSGSYRLLEATDGEQGIKMAIEHIPDLVICDIMLPKKDGYEVSATLKEEEKTSHIPVILLTARSTLEDKLRGLMTRADDYLTKPFIPRELLARIRNLIESRKQLREKYNRQLILKPREITVDSIDEAFLGRVMKAIEENLLNESFNMEQLGKEVGMSRSQIHRKLHALTNQSATQFIRSYRLNRAMDLIRQDAGSISEIAYSVGFSSPSYFNRCFIQHFGCTPTEVRKNTRQDQNPC